MHSVFLMIQLIGLVVILALTIILFKRSSMKNQVMILFYCIFVGINICGYYIELGSHSLEAALNGVRIAYLGKVYALYTMMMVIGQLTGVEIPKWMKKAMFLINTVVYGLVLTCTYHTLYYSSVDFVSDGLFPHLVLGHGIVYYGYTIYLFMNWVGAIGMCIHGYHEAKSHVHRMQILHVMVVALLQITGFVIFLMGISYGYDTTALFNVFSLFVLLRVILKYNLADTLSAAKDQVLDNIDTGVVIIGQKNDLLYANNLAKRMYPALETREIKEAINDIAQYAESGKYKFFGNKVFTIKDQNISEADETTGRMFVLTDVTVSYFYAQSLMEEVDEKTSEVRKIQEELEQFYIQVINALSNAVEAKDRYTNGHSLRVAGYAKEISRRLGMSEDEQREVYYAGLLHDIGKIRVPDSIINKEGKLTVEEFESIKLHTVAGYYILKNVSDVYDVTGAAKWHHERYDGKGYPDGLAGENIPLIARIICVADSYDAMTSNRSYRDALPQEMVKHEILVGIGTQFDPMVADVMLRMIEEDTEYEMRQFVSEQKNILLVDDNEVAIEEIENILMQNSDYAVYCARSSAVCRDILLEQKMDLVIVNMDASDMDGYEIMQKIQSYGDIPIIFITANKEMEMIKKAADLGIRDFLTKPFLPQTLLEIVHNVLQQKQSALQ